MYHPAVAIRNEYFNAETDTIHHDRIGILLHLRHSDLVANEENPFEPHNTTTTQLQQHVFYSPRTQLEFSGRRHSYGAAQ
jgi:hypothetical protein